MPATVEANPQGNCGYYEVEKHEDERGCLWVPDVPFEPKHQFVVTNLDGHPRGNHAHREANQVIWLVQGSMTAVLQKKSAVVGDTRARCNVVSMVPGYAIVVGPMTWITLCGFSPDCVYQVWSDHEYDESEYVRDPHEFASLTGCNPRPVMFAEGQVHVGDSSWIS